MSGSIMKMYFVVDKDGNIVDREARTGSGYTKIGFAKAKATLRNKDSFYKNKQPFTVKYGEFELQDI